jgi:glutamate N-acetyltransferase / amino-acid N-acetyltransferase
VSVTAARGFLAAGITAGLKPSGTPDLALVVNAGPDRAAAGVFTRNRVKAAPVLWSQQVLTDGRLQAVILNSGGANACTGPDGFAVTHATAERLAGALRQAPALRQAQGPEIGAIDVAVCSTGLIGVPLPLDKITAALDPLVAGLSDDGGTDAAQAIMTTDTVAKQASVAGDGWTVGGMAKGAAMLAPGLATMLVLITTDAVIDPAELSGQLAEACRLSFERVDSDGCMSTNDTVIVMSSGASGIAPKPADFQHALTDVCLDLARALIDDAEGAAHSITVTVRGAATEADAVEVGKSVARSNLLKCAIFGRDPNWGRVLAAVGTTSATFEPDQLDVAINKVLVCRAGGIGEPRELVDLGPRDASIEIDLHAGSDSASIWTTDLTYDYVKENAEYST